MEGADICRHSTGFCSAIAHEAPKLDCVSCFGAAGPAGLLAGGSLRRNSLTSFVMLSKAQSRAKELHMDPDQPKHLYEALCELVARNHTERSVSNENTLCGKGATEVARVLAAEREREGTMQAKAVGLERFRSTATTDAERLSELLVRLGAAQLTSAVAALCPLMQQSLSGQQRVERLGGGDASERATHCALIPDFSRGRGARRMSLCTTSTRTPLGSTASCTRTCP